MLETLRNAFKIKDIRNRIIFTFLMLVVIRIGSQLPIPGVNNELFSNWFASQTADGMGFFDAITGGSFYNMSIFALNITPYITSSIIMQLLTIAIPKLEEMQRDGEEGRKKIAEITRYLTVALALIEAGVVKNPRDGVKILGNGELLRNSPFRQMHSAQAQKKKLRLLVEKQR